MSYISKRFQYNTKNLSFILDILTFMSVFDNLGRLFALECSLFKQMFHMLPENLLALEQFTFIWYVIAVSQGI